MKYNVALNIQFDTSYEKEEQDLTKFLDLLAKMIKDKVYLTYTFNEEEAD